MLYHVIVQLARDELNGMYSHKRQIPGCIRLHEQGQHPEEGLAARRSPEHRISCPMGLQLSSERKARKRSPGVGSSAEPAHRKAGKAPRRICNPQEQELEVLEGPLGLKAWEEFYFIICAFLVIPLHSIPTTGASVHPLESFPNLPPCFCRTVLCPFLISLHALHLNDLGCKRFS